MMSNNRKVYHNQTHKKTAPTQVLAVYDISFDQQIEDIRPISVKTEAEQRKHKRLDILLSQPSFI